MQLTDGQWIALAIFASSLFMTNAIKDLANSIEKTFNTIDIRKFIEETRLHGLKHQLLKIDFINQDKNEK